MHKIRSSFPLWQTDALSIAALPNYYTGELLTGALPQLLRQSLRHGIIKKLS